MKGKYWWTQTVVFIALKNYISDIYGFSESSRQPDSFVPKKFNEKLPQQPYSHVNNVVSFAEKYTKFGGFHEHFQLALCQFCRFNQFHIVKCLNSAPVLTMPPPSIFLSWDICQTVIEQNCVIHQILLPEYKKDEKFITTKTKKSLK